MIVPCRMARSGLPEESSTEIQYTLTNGRQFGNDVVGITFAFPTAGVARLVSLRTGGSDVVLPASSNKSNLAGLYLPVNAVLPFEFSTDGDDIVLVLTLDLTDSAALVGGVPVIWMGQKSPICT